MKNRKLIIFLLLLSGLFISITYFFYKEFYLSPRYSMYQIYQSIQNKDQKKFQKYVDLDSVIENLINQIIEKNTISGNSSFLEKIQSKFTIRILTEMKPVIIKNSRDLILFSIFSKAETINHSHKSENLQFFIENLTPELLVFINDFEFTKIIFSISSIEYKYGEIAIVTIQNNRDLKLVFKKVNNYWQLKELSNLLFLN